MKPTSAKFYYGASEYPVAPANIRRFLPDYSQDEASMCAGIERGMSRLSGGHQLKIEQVLRNPKLGTVRFIGDGFAVNYTIGQAVDHE